MSLYFVLPSLVNLCRMHWISLYPWAINVGRWPIAQYSVKVFQCLTPINRQDASVPHGFNMIWFATLLSCIGKCIWANHDYNQDVLKVFDESASGSFVWWPHFLPLFMRRPKGLIYAEESFVKNGRIIGGSNAQYNTWQWQVRPSGYILNCDFN